MLVDLLIGLQWVLDNVDFFRPAVVLLSLHVRGIDLGIEDVIQKITEAGVLIVTSAGNSGIGAQINTTSIHAALFITSLTHCCFKLEHLPSATVSTTRKIHKSSILSMKFLLLCWLAMEVSESLLQTGVTV